MKRKISLYTKKSSDYIFTNFLKQYKKSLHHYNIGEMLNSKQILSVLSYMGFIDQQPNQQDIQLSKTITKMLSQQKYTLAVRRINLFYFLIVLCDIEESRQFVQGSYFQEEISGLPIDNQNNQQPLIVIEFGRFDQNGKWSCLESQRKQIQTIFAAMKLKRISRNQVQSRKKSSKKQQKQQTFQPTICTKSEIIFQQKLKKIALDKKQPVQNRLLHSKNAYQQKMKQQFNKSLQKQLKQCTFKPAINNTRNRSLSQQNLNILSNSQTHLNYLINKGTIYKERRQNLKQLHIKLNESSQLQDCTFKPQTTKHSQSTKWAYVRNRDKQIQRLRQGRKHRQFINQVKQRGYPVGVNWSQFINKKQNITTTMNEQKMPILCIDLKIMNEQYNINVFNGQNIVKIAERISKQHKIAQKMWWKVEELIRKAVQQCTDIRVQNNKIFSEN